MKFVKLQDFNFMHFDHHADKHPLNKKRREISTSNRIILLRCATLRNRRFELVSLVETFAKEKFKERWKLPAIISMSGYAENY